MRFTIRSLEHCLSDDASVEVRSRIHHAHSEPPCRITLPPLTLGSTFLERMAVRELPGGADWRQPSYEAFASPLFVVNDAVLHSSAGILVIGDTVVEETLAHTSEAKNGYKIDGSSIGLHGRGSKRLSGPNASLLTGSGGNYFHTVIDSVARLAITKDAGVPPFRSLLLPKDAPQARKLLDWPRPIGSTWSKSAMTTSWRSNG